MGRYIRPLLRGLAQEPGIALTLLVRDPAAAAAYRAIAGPRIDVERLPAALEPDRFDRVWYPWNGIRFGAAAAAVVTINDDFAFRYPARGIVARLREQRPVRTAIRRAAHILTISAWSRRALVARFELPPQRVSAIALTPDPFFTPGPATRPFAGDFVLTVGAGEPRKNVPFLIEAFARAFPHGDTRLVIVGRPDPAVAACLRQTTVPITSLPQIDDARLRDLYRSAAAVAVPSLAEGFGLVAAEAQACGAAVIAAAATGLLEAVGDAALLVAPDDGRGWQAALRALVHDPDRNAEYRARARRRWPTPNRSETLSDLVRALKRPFDDRS